MNIKKKIKQDGQAYFSKITPDIDFKGKIEFKSPNEINESPKVSRKPLYLSLGYLSLVTVAALIIGTSLFTRHHPYFNNEDYGLAQVRSLEELKNLLSSGQNVNSNRILDFSNDATAGVPESDAGEDNHSETNVQVQGVDEGDIIKTDGQRIYYINYNSLKVFNLLDEGEIEIVLDEAMESTNASNEYTYFSDLYITDDYLIVLGQRYSFFTYDAWYLSEEASGDDDAFIEPYWTYSAPQTMIFIYDLTDLQLETEIQITGNLITSRLIDDTIYLISNYYLYLNDDIEDPRPVLRQDDEIFAPEFFDIKYVPGTPLQSFTIITSIVLNEEIESDFDIFLGSSYWSQIYVSASGIYMVGNSYDYGLLGFDYRVNGHLISYLFKDGGGVEFGGAGSFRGYVINQFAMDEYENYFRIVTTEGWGSNAKNRLYVFERVTNNQGRQLEAIGIIDSGLGKPGETVRSVRFINTEAFVVTYEQIDPLYKIDLSDPSDPKIIGQLEVTGFSTYLHPWEEGLMIGIGYEAEGANTTGLKLSLYDVTGDDPEEIGTALVLNNDNSWQYSEALFNHKAILVAKPYDFIGFAINKYNWFEIYDYYMSSDYQIFSIDPNDDQPIKIDASISHYQIISQEQLWMSMNNYVSIDRAVYVGNYLYVTSNVMVSSHQINNQFQLTDYVLY
jgi:inhibitor of cysteine peptidase